MNGRQIQVNRVSPRLTACDQCGAPLPPELVAELQKSPRFHTCSACVAKGHMVIGLGGK